MLDLELYFEVKFFLALLKCFLRNVVLWYLYKVVRSSIIIQAIYDT